MAVTGAAYTEIKLGANTVANGGNYVFRAPSDNYYTFTYENPADPTDTYVIGSASLEANETYECEASDYLSSVEPGKEVTLRVTAREVKGSVTAAEAGNPIKLASTQAVWYEFIAPEENRYTFSFEAKDGKAVTVSRATSLMDTYLYPLSNNQDIVLKADEKIYLIVSSDDATAEAPVEVTLKITKREMAGAAPAAGAPEAEVKFTKAGAKYYAFTATTSGFYKFTATAAQSVELSVFTSITEASGKVTDNASAASVVYYVDANKTIYLKVEPSSVPDGGEVPVKLKTETVTTVLNGADTKTFTLDENGKITVYFRITDPVDWSQYKITVIPGEDGMGVTIDSSRIDGNGSVWDYNIYKYDSKPLTGKIELRRYTGTGTSLEVKITKEA